MITLMTPLPKGKFKGKSILEIAPVILEGDWNYVAWILNNWSDKFSEEVYNRHGWHAHCLRTGFGSGGGITLEHCEKNN